MKKTMWRSLVSTVALLWLAACTTTGEIAMDLGSDNMFYISPKNQDGLQDSFSVPASVVPVERSVIGYFRVEVLDAGGNPVYAYEETAERSRFFWQRRRQSVETPEIVLWDGTDGDGEYVPDAPYRVAFEVRDSKDRTERIDDIVVIVDNRAPFVEPSVSFSDFSPNGDGRLDTITLFQRRSSIEDLWRGEILDESGAIVRSWDWQGAATDVVWDGTGSDGSVMPSATYSYRVSSTDRAGNSASFAIPEILLDTVPRSVTVAIDRRSFSPNGDGVLDTVTLTMGGTNRNTVTAARLEIVDVAGRSVRNLPISTGSTSVLFDGRGNNGVVLADGDYRAVLTADHVNGDTVSTASPVFALDTTPPRVAASADYRIFSPDGDGRRDTITFRQSSDFDSDGVGEIAAGDGTVVRRYEWSGAVEDLVWDGTDESERTVPDGTYSYRVSSRDAAGNSGRTTIDAIRLDTRPTPVSVHVSAPGFSPNADGRFDTISFTLATPSDATVERWTLEVRNIDRRIVRSYNETGALPAEPIDWNGLLAETEDGTAGTIADGSYYSRVLVEFEKGNLSRSTSESFVVDTTGPVVNAVLPQGLFSPDGDGTRDLLVIDLSIRDPSPISNWYAQIFDPTGQEFWRQAGTRPVPRRLTWDGRSLNGERVQSVSTYPLEVVATDVYGNPGRTNDAIETDILVIRQGDSLRIVLSNINFAPFTADYLNLAPEIAATNVANLDRVYQVLTQYPTYDIRIEGHAVSLLWADPARARTEQQNVLLPLSLARSEAIKRALVQRGIDPDRITTRGYGGAFPVVPHSDEINRWKSRRVEFILQER